MPLLKQDNFAREELNADLEQQGGISGTIQRPDLSDLVKEGDNPIAKSY